MNWPGPTFTDSGGFQVLSLGAGFRKVLAMDTERVRADDIIAEGKERLARVDDDGVTFTSHLDGSTPPVHTRGVDPDPAPDRRRHHLRVRRTDHPGEHPRLPGGIRAAHAPVGGALPGRTPQADGGQPGPPSAGAVRRGAGRPVRGPAAGSGARAGVRSSTTTAAASTATASAVRWRSRTSPRSSDGSAASCPPTNRGTCWGSANPTTFSTRSPRAPTRSTVCRRHASRAMRRCIRRPVATTSPAPATAATSPPSTPNVTATPARITPAPTFTTCSRPRRCWPSTLCTIHNERFVIRLVDQIRMAIRAGEFDELRAHVLGRYYATAPDDVRHPSPV